MPLSAGTRLGPYLIGAPIGAGGMGEVYRATDTKLGRDVALKILPELFTSDTDRLARFRREAQVLAALNHPNIAAIYGFEDSGTAHALVMELVEGDDLSALIARGAMPLAEALPIARQIADALEAAHEQGIIHRDLKPANIKVRADGTVKVLDFGLAKAMDPAGASGADAMRSPTLTARATQMGVILGTAAYMAPEQARGKVVDRCADIWSFGVVLYEMLTGRRAFEGDDISITLASVLKEDVNWGALPADLPSPIPRLLRRCLEKDPKRRLQAIGEARIAIEDVIAGAGRETADALKAAPLRSSGLVWKIAAGVLGATTVALGVVAVPHLREQAPVGEVVRFSIPAPEGAEATRPTISPDGRQVAFVASRQIWVHSLESSVSRLLPDTEGAGSNSLVWSPDGREVAFALNGKLQKVAVAGGRPQPIADLPSVFLGSTWGREGVIVLGGNQGLIQVPEAGGAPAVLVPSDPSGKVVMGLPNFLPDGRHFLYSSLETSSLSSSPDVTHAEIYLGSLDRSQAPRRLDTKGLVLGFAASPDPSVVYLLLGRRSLLAQAFDIRRLELTGEARPIAANIDDEALRAASTSTTGVLAYQTPGARGKFQLTWFDRTGKALGVESLAGDLQAPNLSRDGKRLAIERREGRNADIWVIDLSRGTTTRITTDPGDDIRPVLSPDGTRVAFARAASLYQKSATGAGDEERLGEGETMDWSPDGQFISFLLKGDLWALPLSGDRTPVLIAGGKFIERRGRFSPDSKWVAYESNVSGRYEIYLQPFPPKADQRQMISVNGGDSAYWRADGRELFFHSPDDQIMAVDIRPGPAPVPSVPRALFRLPAGVNNGRFVTTLDGQRFLVPLEVQKPKPGVTMIALNWLEALKSRPATAK